MTTEPATPTVDHHAINVVRDLASIAASPAALDPQAAPSAWVIPDGYTIETRDPWRAPDPLRDEHPDRKRGTVALHDTASFAAYVNDHADGEATSLYADLPDRKITAVLNGHHRTDPTAGWGDHRAVYDCPTTDDFAVWYRHDGKLLDQAVFAEHLEDQAHVIVDPDSATMIELAKTFEARTDVDFRSATVLESGERALRWQETIDARAGASGQIEIPSRITVALTPFEGGETAFKIEARFRYRIREGKLSLGYQLLRVQDVLREAFDELVGQVVANTGLTAYRGTAPAA